MLKANKSLPRLRLLATVGCKHTVLLQSAAVRCLSQSSVVCQEKSSPKPWYLNVGNRERELKQTIFQAQDITFPFNSPASLVKMSNFLRDELGLTDIVVFDLREGVFETAAAKICNFMVLATAGSPKHCQTSFEKLNSLIKQEYESFAHVEGQYNAKEHRKRQRRLARRPNLASNSNSTAPTESWFMIDTKVDRIFVNILTHKRRQEINLEELYAPEEEKAKYVRSQPEESATEVNSEDNILSGLRRLVNQRREYSTVAPAVLVSGKLLQNLHSQDYPSAVRLINNNKDQSLPLMQTLVEWVSNLPIEGDAAVPWKKWVTAFESCWPLVLPEEKAAQYWSLRLRFFKLVNMADMKHYNLNNFFNDYLLAKKAAGTGLLPEDLVEFLKLAIINTRNSDKNIGYWELVHSNDIVVKALRLFEDVRGADAIVKDGSVVTMLLRTMVSGQEVGERATRLHAIYEVSDYLVDTFGPELSPPTIAGILEVLAAAKDWNKYLQFWEAGIGGLVPGADRRPWAHFIRLAVESGDVDVMRKLLSEGHLLWLDRLQVEIDDELKAQLGRLFARADPDNLWFQELQDHLLLQKL
ncbi:probable ATPase synthesis protein 25,mitochondrial [Zygosaccharomyces bailii ISA1307]|nr:probable ATPase synthesis protein 25,mitochondrial [Zygosaccharomyces bailii ISA1307]